MLKKLFKGIFTVVGILLGTTGGYIIGFLGSALLYWAITARLGTKPVVMAVTMVLGLIVCYAFGTAWFVLVYTRTSGAIGVMTALGLCVFPYLLPDAAKIRAGCSGCLLRAEAGRL